MDKQDVVLCQFSCWYSKFKDVTFKSKIIDLTGDVIDYLQADGIVLPKGCEDVNNRSNLEGDSDEETDWGDENDPGAEGPSFPQLNAEITKAIQALGGKVFPKLNWSCPKDATWIALDNTLRCTCPRDVFLLLKSSHFIMHDLANPFSNCKDYDEPDPNLQYQLVLRRWHNLNPSGEFRCFVKSNTLIGISQRQNTAFYESVVKHKQSITTDVVKFFTDRIQGKFSLQNYIFDVYVKEEGRVFLVDFNPFGPTTDSLMFEWDELDGEKPLGFNLAENTEIIPVFRCVDTEQSIRSSTYEQYAMPQDFVHLSTGQDPQKLIDFLKMKTQQADEESSQDEDSDSDDTSPVSL